MDEFLEAENDVIMICSSILSLTEVVMALPLRRLKRPALFADVLSVKEYPREVLLKVCTHILTSPIFPFELKKKQNNPQLWAYKNTIIIIIIIIIYKYK